MPDCECVILLRPTQSLTLYIQQAMRGMRINGNNPNKTAIIIDHVGNVYRHGFVDDNRDWTLSAKKRKEENEVKIKECSNCFAVFDASKKQCPYCETEINIIKQTKDKKTVEIDLIEVKRKEDIKNADYKEYANCKTFDDLVEFQKIRKYKFGWVLRIAQELNIEIPKKYNYMRRFVN